jgi:hypothetical protein
MSAVEDPAIPEIQSLSEITLDSRGTSTAGVGGHRAGSGTLSESSPSISRLTRERSRV